MSRDVVHDGAGGLHVRFAFDRRLVDVVKSLPRRRWHAVDKLWIVPAEDVVALVDLLHPEGFDFDETVRRLYAESGGAHALRPGLKRPGPPAGRGLFDAEPAEAPPVADEAANWTVGRLNRAVKAVLESAFPVAIWLVGEIAGYNRSRHKRHAGFNLIERDETGGQAFQVQAILFEGARREIERKLAAAGDPFRLEDEIEVRVKARVDLYDAWGSYRVQVEDLDVAYTLGEAARRREEIVRKLGAEGLLERNSGIPFPELPLRVGLITSLDSDAFHDVVRTLRESGFAFRVIAHGARVQGRSTESSVLNALDWFAARRSHLDVVLICRGGGSRTDLAWFDSEALGRAVATFPIPVVVGIGHEQDISVLDHVARRAKTPTAAAALLVDAVREALRRAEDAGVAILDEVLRLLDTERRNRRDAALRLARGTTRCLEAARAGLAAATRQLDQGARRDLATEARRIAEATRGLLPRASRAMTLETERTGARGRRLDLLDPRRVIERGYAILRSGAGRVVTAAQAAPAGTRLVGELRSGRLALVSEGDAAEAREER